MPRYPGGKNAEGTWQWIIGRMRPHVRFAEPFAGSAAVARFKLPALETVVCDLDPSLVEFWRRLDFPGVRALNCCGLAWLREHADELGPEWLVYLDPPYLPETRVRRRLYRYEMTKAQHVELLKIATRLRCGVMISGYWSTLYGEALRGWSVARRRVRTRGGSWRTEHLWSNFTGDASSDYAARLPGRDYRERERIKKRVRSWSNKFARMPTYERTAVLAELVRAAAATAESGGAGSRFSSTAGNGERRRRPPFSAVTAESTAAADRRPRRKRR